MGNKAILHETVLMGFDEVIDQRLIEDTLKR